jgi:hypothetical protein
MLRSCLLVLTLVWAGTSCAQPPVDSPVPPKPAKVEDETEIREAKTEIFHLRDAQGNLVKVANLSLEEFEQLYKLRRQLLGSKAPPEFAIEEVVYTGQATATHATLNVRVKVRLVAEQASQEWIRVPLGFASTVLQGAVGHDGPGDFFVALDRTDGYVCWLKAATKTSHTINLKLITILKIAGDETRLAITGPLARSRFQKFRVATGKAEVVDAELSVTSQASGPGMTDLTFDFSGGELQLAWLAGGRMTQQAKVQLLADSTTRMTIKSPQQITAQSELTISAAGGNVTSFEVRLPPYMQVLDLSQQDFRITVLPVDEDSKVPSPEAGRRQRLQVVPVVPAPEVKIALETIYRHSGQVGKKTGQPTEFSGFEVVGAVRQSGSIDFVVEGNWTLQWSQSGEVRRVDERPDVTTPQQVQARFEFFSERYSLTASLRPEKTRLRIEPRYVVAVSTDELRLDISLAGQLRGSGQVALLLDLPGWTVEQVTSNPVELLERDSVQISPAGKVRIPLVLVPEATGGQFGLQILARRDVDLTQELKFSLPKPAVAEPLGAAVMTLAPAMVGISPQDNIILTPQTEEISGLVRDAVPEDVDQWNLPRTQREVLFYRERGDDPDPLFAATPEIRDGVILVNSQGKIVLDSQVARVDQILVYQVDYEPVSQVLIEIPQSPGIQGDLQVWLLDDSEGPVSETEQVTGNRQLLSWKLEETISPEKSPEEVVSQSRNLISVTLPQQQIGSFRLALRYPYDLGVLENEKSRLVQVPLVVSQQVEGVTFEGHFLEVSSPTDLDVEPVGETWLGSPRLVDTENQFVRLEVSTANRAHHLPMSVLLRKRSPQSLIVVQQAWLQTYLTASGQRHRAVFRLTTNEPRVQLNLPRSTSLKPGNIRAAINHQPVPLEDIAVSALGDLSLTLGQPSGQRDYVLELWYWSHDQYSGIGQLAVEMPRIKNVRRMERFFWQLITPSNEHLVAVPPVMTAEQEWAWNKGSWGRQPNLSQQDLEQWIGATVQDPVPASSNRYLYTSIGPVVDLEVRMLGRATILMVASGSTLLIGLLLIYLPGFRHPVLLLCGGLVLLSGALLTPESVLLVSQSAALGLVLVLVARILNWLMLRRQDYRWPRFVYGSGGSERNSGEYVNSQGDLNPVDPAVTSTFTREIPTSEPGA